MTHPNQFPDQPITQEMNELTAQPVLHDLEVVARNVDMIPASSDLGRYFAEPAKDLVKGEDGHSRVVDSDQSNLDRFKHDAEKALGDFNNGKVARIKLMHGMVNAHIDAHKGSGLRNMRYAFEQLHHFNITGDAGFHTLLSSRGRTIGNLEYNKPGEVESEHNEAIFAEAATAILNGENSVMLNDPNDKPHDKLYGMIDPETGERLKNAFLLVGGGTFSDQEGTTSNFSNLAWADVVLVPDSKLAATEQPTEQAEFDIDKVDWSPFEHNNFKVRRSGGKVDEGGWTIKNVFQDNNGVYRARIIGWDPDKGGSVRKDVPVEDLVNWQKEEEQ